MNLGLLLCDHVSPRFRDIAGDYPDMIATLLRPHAPEIKFTSFEVTEGALPADITACDAYLCTGSRFSAYDDLAWIHALQDLVRRLHDARRPFVGICFGHQILARALGGDVQRIGWGVGVHAIDIDRQEDWMQPTRENLRLAHMHRDQVIRLPEGAKLLGQSEHCPVALFRAGETMLGIQAHPEFPSAYSEALMRDRAGKIGSDRVEAGIRSLEQPTDESVVAKWITSFLRGLV